MPDQRWLLDALSALNPDHMVFQKGYVPEKTAVPGLSQKLDLLREHPEMKHPLFIGLPPLLLARKKSLKNAIPAIVQPQVSTFLMRNFLVTSFFIIEPTKAAGIFFGDEVWEEDQRCQAR